MGPYAVSWVDGNNKQRVVRFSTEESAYMFARAAELRTGRAARVACLPGDLTEAELIYESPLAQFNAEDR